VEEHVLCCPLRGGEGLELRHGARATDTGERQQSGTAALVPEQIGVGRGRVLADPVVAGN
jgi:hypothetical protein